jgi:hypothetical protein
VGAGGYEAVAGLGRSSPGASRPGGAAAGERPDAGWRLAVRSAARELAGRTERGWVVRPFWAGVRRVFGRGVRFWRTLRVSAGSPSEARLAGSARRGGGAARRCGVSQ